MSVFGLNPGGTAKVESQHTCVGVRRTQSQFACGTCVVVVAVVTLGQWDPHRCNRTATVSYTPGTAELAGTAEQPH
jgi:hypothetical protein